MTEERMPWTWGRRAVPTAVALALVGLAASPSAWSQVVSAPLFPKPFVVEHGVTQHNADGSTFETPKVTDYYGGSWIVSVRPDGSRTMVDFARREITEIRPKQGTYSVVNFDGFADLRGRLRRAERQPAQEVKADAAHGSGAAAAQAHTPSYTIEEIPVAGVTPMAGAERDDPGAVLRSKPGVLHLRVSRVVAEAQAPGASQGAAKQTLEVWLDPTVRLDTGAQATLARFEGEVIGSDSPQDGPGASGLLVAARERAGGAFPIKTVRTASRATQVGPVGSVEDVVTRLEWTDKYPVELLKVPDGYRRVAHSLEVMVAYAEKEAGRARATSGTTVK